MMKLTSCLRMIKHGRAALSLWNWRHLHSFNNLVNLHSRTFSSNVLKTFIQLLYIKNSPSIYYLPLQHHSTELPLSKRPLTQYVEVENEFFHKYLDKNYEQYTLGKTSASSLTDDEISAIIESVESATFDVKNVENILGVLNELSQTSETAQNQLFGNTSFESLVKDLTDLLPNMDDKTFWMSTEAVTNFNARIYMIKGTERDLRMHIIQAFDAEFEKRSVNWSVKQCLRAADFYYHYRCSNSPQVEFMPQLFIRLEKEADLLSRIDIVVALYHASLYRYASTMTLQRLLSSAHKSLHHVSIEDIGIICAGLHKSKNMVYGTIFLDKLVRLTKNSLDRMSDPTLSMTLKYIRRHGDKRMKKTARDTFDTIINMQPLLTLRVKYSHIHTVLHTLELYDKLRNVSQELLSASCKKFLQEDMSMLRLKDLAKFSVILRKLAPPFAYDSEMEAVLERVRLEVESAKRMEERQKFLPYVLVCLVAFSMKGVYPHKLLQEVYGEEGIAFFLDKGLFWTDLYFVSESVQIEDPSYNGPRLPEQYCKVVLAEEERKARKQTNSIRNKMLQNIAHCLSETVGGKELLQIKPLLPQFQSSDIEIHVDQFGYAVPPRISSQEVSFLPPATSLAVVIHGINAYYTFRTTDGRDYDCLTGLHKTKIRQLKQVGYKVLEIPHFEWEATDDKDAYIRNKWFNFNKV